MIGRYLLTPGDHAEAAARVADAYRIPVDAMEAAVAYYRRYRAAIDAYLASLDAA